MSPVPPSRTSTAAAVIAYERRKRAAWMDYLRVTGEAPRDEYGHVEENAWEQLQRRLRRNDELLAMATEGASAPPARA